LSETPVEKLQIKPHIFYALVVVKMEEEVLALKRALLSAPEPQATKVKIKYGLLPSIEGYP
jgi:hypothetical protein